MYYKYPHGDEVYNVVTAYLCTDYDGVPTMDGNESQELHFFNYTDFPNELSPPDKIIIQKFLERV